MIAIESVRTNYQGIGVDVFRKYQLIEAFKDIRTWIFFFWSIFLNIPNGGIQTFGSVVINSFGFDVRTSLILDMPAGIVSVSMNLILPPLSDYFRDRTSFASLGLLIPMIGCIMLTTLPLTDKAPLLVGFFFISSALAGWGLGMSLLSNNTLGYTKKIVVNGMQMIAFAVGNSIGAQIFQANQAPEYHLAKTLCALFYGLSIVSLLLMRVVNMWANRQRNKKNWVNEFDNEEFFDYTDWEQKGFRYMM